MEEISINLASSDLVRLRALAAEDGSSEADVVGTALAVYEQARNAPKVYGLSSEAAKTADAVAADELQNRSGDWGEFMLSSGWDAAYATGRAPWDIPRAQPAFVRVAERGGFKGRVLDAGCGTGEVAMLAAAHGADAVGVDISGQAIGQARAKAARRGLNVRFEVGSVFKLSSLRQTFDAIADTGMFHIFDDDDRARYAASLASVLAPGGLLYLECFSNAGSGAAGSFGPRRVGREEFAQVFADGWTVVDVIPEFLQVAPGATGNMNAPAWLATIRRT
jgi:SAM-dependent methyltransferase